MKRSISLAYTRI